MADPAGLLRVELPALSRRVGAPRYLLARMPTAEEFFLAMPAAVPETRCFEAMPVEGRRETVWQTGRWIEEIVRAVIVEPALPADVDLGADEEHVALSLLRAWGWLEAADVQALRARYADAGRLDRVSLLDAVLAQSPVLSAPGAALSGILRQMARHTGRLPSELVRLPVAEFFFDYRVILSEAMRAKQGRRGAGGAINDAANGPDEIPIDDDEDGPWPT